MQITHDLIKRYWFSDQKSADFFFNMLYESGKDVDVAVSFEIDRWYIDVYENRITDKSTVV